MKISPTTAALLSVEGTHIDDWLDNEVNREAHPVAHAFFEAFRRPAVDRHAKPYDGKLFCDFEGKRWRCIGASRMGDVWLTSDFARENGYDRRVYIDGCSNWGAEP